MSVYDPLIGKQLEYTVSGKPASETGLLVDAGDDILVFHRNSRYYYTPTRHIQQLRVIPYPPKEEAEITESPMDRMTGESISYRKTLLMARGMFVELHVTGIHPLTGYMTSIMNDYLVFNSSVFGTVYVSLEHLKAIVPFPLETLPFGTHKDTLPVKQAGLTLARSMEQQLKKMEGSLVVLDLGDAPGKIGLLRSVDQGVLTLIAPGGEEVYWGIHHVKSAHMP